MSKGRYTTTPMNAEWKARLDRNTEDALQTWPELKALYDRLMSVGGQGVALCREEDLAKLLERGEVVSGRGSVLMPGDMSRCHANAADLWEQNREAFPGRVKIVTGWALSKDGCWRQHTWLWDSTRRKVVETTKKRVAYFGFTLTDEEASQFYWNNL